MYNRGIYAVFSIHFTHIMLIEYVHASLKENKDKQLGLNDIHKHYLLINIQY